MLFTATYKIRCRAPGVTRQHFEASHHIDENDCRVSSQRSIRDRAQSCPSVTTV